MSALVLWAAPSAEGQEPDLVTSPEQFGEIAEAAVRGSQHVLRRLRPTRRRRTRARRTGIGVEDARALFRYAVVASVPLVTLEVVPADANHEVRGWDETFGHLTRPTWLSLHPRFDLPYHDCSRREVEALLVFSDIQMARSGIYTPGNEGLRGELLERVAQRRLLADEAAARRREGLSCEDLPTTFEFHLSIPELDAPSPWVAVNIALFGRDAIERIRARRREMPDHVFDLVLGFLRSRSSTDGDQDGEADPLALVTPIPAPTVPACGRQVLLSDETSMAWARLGVRFQRPYFAYSAAAGDGALILRAAADIDCDGTREVYVTAITRTESGEIVRSRTRLREDASRMAGERE